MKFNLDNENKPQSGKDKIFKDCQNEVFKYIDDTMFPYFKCVLEERIDMKKEMVDELPADAHVKNEIKSDLDQVKKIFKQLNKINGKNKDQLKNDVKQIVKAM